MQARSTIGRVAATTLATMAVAVPPATAMPIDGPVEHPSAGSQAEAPLPPTWPAEPTPIPSRAADPTATTDVDGGLIDSTAGVIIAAGGIGIVGGLAYMVRQARAPRSRAAH